MPLNTNLKIKCPFPLVFFLQIVLSKAIRIIYRDWPNRVKEVNFIPARKRCFPT